MEFKFREILILFRPVSYLAKKEKPYFMTTLISPLSSRPSQLCLPFLKTWLRLEECNCLEQYFI
jgi:hypothetical protein